MREKHPLSSRPLTVARWLSARHVVVSARANGPVFEDLALQQRGLARDVAVRCQHYYAACEAVAASDLLLTLPRHEGDWVTLPLPLPLPLQFAPMPLPMGPIPIMLYWHRAAEEDSGNAWFRELLQRLAARASVTEPSYRTRSRRRASRSKTA